VRVSDSFQDSDSIGAWEPISIFNKKNKKIFLKREHAHASGGWGEREGADSPLSAEPSTGLNHRMLRS